MWWFLLALEDLDFRCDEVTLTTEHGYVCEFVIKQVPMTDIWIHTPRGAFRVRECPRGTQRIGVSEHCDEKSFKVVYELVVTTRPPVPYVVPTKFGMWIPLGAKRYVCHSGHMNGQGQCEIWEERRKKR